MVFSHVLGFLKAGASAAGAHHGTGFSPAQGACWQGSPLQASEGISSLGAGTLLRHVEKEEVLKLTAWPELP